MLSDDQVFPEQSAHHAYRNYALDAEEKREMRRLYPDVVFDWKKIAQQLAEKREICRDYRSRRRTSGAARPGRDDGPHIAVFDPATRTVYVNGLPSTPRAAGALLDAILKMDRTSEE